MRQAQDGAIASLLWVTNVASPYRRPVWEAVARVMPLEIALLESDRTMASDGRRGADWSAEGLRDLIWRPLRSIRLGRGERRYHVLLGGARRRPRGREAILLGGWESPAYWQMLVGAKLRRARIVGFYESTLRSNRYRSGPIASARRLFFASLDAVVVPGPAAAAALRAFGVTEDRIWQGFNAVDVRRFNEIAVAERSQHSSAPGHAFVHVGQLIERKNVAAVLEAFARIRDQHDRLLVVGEGELRSALESQARLLGLDQHVEFAGYLDNLETVRRVATAQTLILASHEEVWGLVVNEALACGLDVVVSAQCGVAESVHGMAGVRVYEGGAEELAATMRDARDEWQGYHMPPEILEMTPERFASVFLDAVQGRRRIAGTAAASEGTR